MVDGIKIEDESEEEYLERMRDKTRRKVLGIGKTSIRYLLNDDYEVVFDEALPDDYEVVAVHSDFKSDGIDVVIRSDEYDPVPDGMEYPRIYHEGFTIKEANDE